jgi:hypothetical protein
MKRDGTGFIRTVAVQRIQTAGLRAGPPIPAAWRAQNTAVVFATNEADSSNVWEIEQTRDRNEVFNGVIGARIVPDVTLTTDAQPLGTGAVISHGLWTRAFGGSTDVLGPLRVFRQRHATWR